MDEKLEVTKEDTHVQQKFDALIKALNTFYPSLPRLLWRSFLQGLFSALGATIGLSIILAISAFFINRMQIIPSIINAIVGLSQQNPIR